MKLKGKYYLIIVLIFLLAGIYSCQKEQKEQTESTTKEGISGSAYTDSRLGDLLASMNMHYFTDSVKAPDFELSSVNGERISLAQYRGKAILLSFWATW